MEEAKEAVLQVAESTHNGITILEDMFNQNPSASKNQHTVTDYFAKDSNRTALDSTGNNFGQPIIQEIADCDLKDALVFDDWAEIGRAHV